MTDFSSAAQPAPFRNFNGMCWPVPGERLDQLEYALRYGPKVDGFDMKDRLLAASVIAAYKGAGAAGS